MNPTTQHVLERLNYEKVLLTSGVIPRRKRVTLDEIFNAALEEPRIYEVLPAILMYRPQVIHRQDRDRKKYPELAKAMKNFFNPEKLPQSFYGVDMQDCLKTALRYRQFLSENASKRKSRTLTLRLGIEDLERLKRLTQRLHTKGVSETIRLLAREKEGASS
ncbi:MAG TPA: hypothetical protein DDW49_02250 [Deltaproteobacteria bacterium]|nr:MAG: hypothetical protein A2048_06785 [Deltaproteobacteria bacterium GWA2_45_12]HBF12205.1 hypothetical protein [Deltaproteobacteria bacterium]